MPATSGRVGSLPVKASSPAPVEPDGVVETAAGVVVVVTSAGVDSGVDEGAGPTTGADSTTRAYSEDVAGAMPFEAVTVKALDPATVGVPVMAPVVAFRVSPVGRAPEVIVNVGAGVPVAVTVKSYAVPTVAVGGRAGGDRRAGRGGGRASGRRSPWAR